ncbi:hypothetical protein VIGAN_UM008200, partial [Vigna angularis var. angularis]
NRILPLCRVSCSSSRSSPLLDLPAPCCPVSTLCPTPHGPHFHNVLKEKKKMCFSISSQCNRVKKNVPKTWKTSSVTPHYSQRAAATKTKLNALSLSFQQSVHAT